VLTAGSVLHWADSKTGAKMLTVTTTSLRTISASLCLCLNAVCRSSRRASVTFFSCSSFLMTQVPSNPLSVLHLLLGRRLEGPARLRVPALVIWDASHWSRTSAPFELDTGSPAATTRSPRNTPIADSPLHFNLSGLSARLPACASNRLCNLRTDPAE